MQEPKHAYRGTPLLISLLMFSMLGLSLAKGPMSVSLPGLPGFLHFPSSASSSVGALRSSGPSASLSKCPSIVELRKGVVSAAGKDEDSQERKPQGLKMKNNGGSTSKGRLHELPIFKSMAANQDGELQRDNSDSSEQAKVSAASSYVPGGRVPAVVAEANKAIVSSIKDALVAVYGDRHYARFHALETIARVPYFAYTSVLHLYETLGWRRRADLMKIHFAESWNELHHLLIMEELGGNAEWLDRLVAVHLAFFYYWMAIALYMASPETAYNLNEMVERHAYDTYDKFLETHEEELKALPPPQIAKEYYQTGMARAQAVTKTIDSPRGPAEICRVFVILTLQITCVPPPFL